MSIKIDYNKCIGCLKCVEDCINFYLVKNAEDESKSVNAPRIAERGRCIHCGHCEAVCPVNAIICDDDSILREDYSGEGPLEIMYGKRTVRKYLKGSTIDKKILDNIIIAGQSAPTQTNRRTCRLILIKDKLPEVYSLSVEWLVEEAKAKGPLSPTYKHVMKQAEDDTILWNAEYLVLVVGNSEFTIDGAITAERMQLQAEFYDIRTGYRGDIQRAISSCDRLREIVGLKRNESVLVAFAMGMSDRTFYRGLIKQNKSVSLL